MQVAFHLRPMSDTMTRSFAILTRGHPKLSQTSQPIVWPDSDLPDELERLHATLSDFRARNGFGRAMAAPQVGVMKRVIVMNLGATPFALINPEITWSSTEMQWVWDDCLSVPDCVVRVERHASISVRYQDEAGRTRHWQELPADLAELVQHEMDHLDGVLMTERSQNAWDVRPIADHAQLVGTARPTHRLSLANIVESARIIPPEFVNSPQYVCEPLAADVGCTLTLKLEFTNPIRSFKGRGASYFVHQLMMKASGGLPTIVCASAGNWGQALAYACRAHQTPIVIYAAHNANPLKIARMRALGAEVRLKGDDFDAAKLAAKSFAARSGGVMVEDGLETAVSEGHGTIAMELLAHGAAYDAVLVPLGNGALLNGIARWFKAASPATRVIGVAARGATAMADSFRSGAIVEHASVNTIADGVAVRIPIPQAVADMRGIVDAVWLVDDAHIEQALQRAYRYAGLLLEPAGAVGLAGVLAHQDILKGQHVATILCGSNVTTAQIDRHILQAADPVSA